MKNVNFGMWCSLASMRDLGSRGRRFESCHSDFWVAQLAEQSAVNRKVVSSSLTPGASKIFIAEWTGEAPAGPHKACFAGIAQIEDLCAWNPVSATLGG